MKTRLKDASGTQQLLIIFIAEIHKHPPPLPHTHKLSLLITPPNRPKTLTQVFSFANEIHCKLRGQLTEAQINRGAF